MKRFDYLAPQSLDEAVAMLASRPEATPLAGGTNVLVQIKEGHRQATALLSLKRIFELHQLSHNGSLVIGAAVTVKEVAADGRIQRDYAALARAAGLIGSMQTRNMATVGGNICNASPSADTAPPLLAFSAQTVLVSASGQRIVPLEDFFVGSGETVMQPGELLKEIVVPASPPGSGSAYVRHIPLAAMDISVVGVAAAVTLDAEGRLARGHLALGAVAPTPMRARQAERLLDGRRPAEELLAEVANLAAEEARPMADIRASVAFRRHLLRVMTMDALQQAVANAQR